jgi:hypothetical protein
MSGEVGEIIKKNPGMQSTGYCCLIQGGRQPSTIMKKHLASGILSAAWLAIPLNCSLFTGADIAPFPAGYIE